MVFHGFLLVSMVFQGNFMVSHSSRLVSMVFHGSRLVCHGSRLVCHGFSWFQVGFSWFFSRMYPPKTVSWPDDPVWALQAVGRLWPSLFKILRLKTYIFWESWKFFYVFIQTLPFPETLDEVRRGKAHTVVQEEEIFWTQHCLAICMCLCVFVYLSL